MYSKSSPKELEDGVTRLNAEDLTTITVRHTIRDAPAVVKLYQIAQELDSDLKILSDWYEELRCSQLPFGELKVGGKFDAACEISCDDNLINHTDLLNQAIIVEVDACLSSPDLEIVPNLSEIVLSAPISRMSETRGYILPCCTSEAEENIKTTECRSHPISSNPESVPSMFPNTVTDDQAGPSGSPAGHQSSPLTGQEICHVQLAKSTQEKSENLPSRGVQPTMYTGFVSMNLYKEGTIVCLLSMGPCVTQQMNQKRGGETLEICLL